MVLLSEILKDFLSTNEISIQQILNNLLNSDKNLSLKTEIYNPKKLATLLTLAKYLKSKKYIKTHNLIIGFIDTYLKYMVSNKRKSRTEVIRALTPLIQRTELENKSNVQIEQ